MLGRFASAGALAATLVLTLVPGCPGPVAPIDGGSTVDTPMRDAGSCTTTTDCDDGLFCNGDETCAAGRCASGAAPDCDDGVACSIDACSEERLRCENRAPDADADGYGAATCIGTGGTPLGNDCDDTDAVRFPGNVEVCDADGHDEDCDEATFGGLDADGDGHVSDTCCNDTRTSTTCGDDCSDARASAYPAAAEVCNTVDDDCDGMVDEGVAATVYVDADRDGYGTGTAMMRCADSVGFSPNDGDCDDTPGTGIAQSPGQPEICDGIRNDCRTTLAADAGALSVDWYRDADGDGFGNAAAGVVSSCVPVAGHSLRNTDCDDSTSSRSPGAAEQCNAVDDDCNGIADYAIAAGDFEDDDADGIVDLSCGPPRGMDCDDTNPATGPGTAESCDGRDNDCDSRIDEGATSLVFYRDLDMDGYGSVASGSVVSCVAPAGYVARGGDCDDAAIDRSPDGTEACNGRDDDCDGAADEAPAASLCPVGPRARDAVCSAGACALGRCETGYADCNLEGADGCEVNVALDPSNCGGCGRSCGTPMTGSAFVCMSGGTCGVTCASGFSDCNARADDGCEVTAATCPTCPPTFVACGLDGCVDPFTDARHCGGCARPCGVGGECVAGRCDSFVAVSAGNAHTCAVRSRGSVVCWGENDFGELGSPAPGAPAPRAVTLAAPAVELASGDTHTCARLVDGRVECWGEDGNAQLGAPGVPFATHNLVALLGPAERIASGTRHVVAAVRDASMGLLVPMGWGDDSLGQITGMPGGSAIAPTIIPMGSIDAAVLAAGNTFTCWGTPFSNPSCTGAITGYFATAMGAVGLSSPSLPVPLTDAVAGVGHVCFLGSGSVWCAGNGFQGELAGPPLAGVLGPASFSSTRSLGSAGDNTCARSVVDTLTCAGRNLTSELGGPYGTRSMVPVAPVGLPRVASVSRGVSARHVCAIDLAGRVWCWGTNGTGQVTGTGVGGIVATPILVSGL